MREVQVVRSLNIELARVFPGNEMKLEYRHAVPVGKVDEYLLAETEIKTRVVPIHTICNVVGHKGGIEGPNSVPIVETKYIAYSPEVEEFFGQPFRAFQDQLLAQASEIKRLNGTVGRQRRHLVEADEIYKVLNPIVLSVERSGFFRRLKYLFTRSL